LNNVIEKIFKPLNDFWSGLEKSKKIRYCIIAAVALSIIVITVLVFSRTEYSVLYSNLDSKEAGEIMSKLQDDNVAAKAKGTGTILVPKNQEASLRMELAASGYPSTGLNYDIFQNSTGFGTTDYEKQKYMQFQLQDRLQSSIKTLDIVNDAIVTLYIPESTSFVLKDDKQNASASVILKLKNNQKPTSGQVKGIEELIAKSVPGLATDQVVIIDSSGNTLNNADSNEAGAASTQLELESSVSDKYKEQINNMLEPIFGVGKVITGVRVSLDFDKKTTESNTYNPVGDSNSGIPASTSESKEVATGGSGTGAGAAGQTSNGGGTPTYSTNTSGGAGNYNKTNKTVNYEINQIKEMVEKAQGNIKDISVSVVVDSKSLKSGDINKVKETVAAASGIDKSKVTVQSMNFAAGNDINGIFNSVNNANDTVKKQAYIRNGIIYGALGLLLLLGAIFLLRKKKSAERAETAAQSQMRAGSNFDQEVDEEFEEYIGKPIRDIDLSDNKSEKSKLIEKNIDKNPEHVAQLLRNWLDDYGGWR